MDTTTDDEKQHERLLHREAQRRFRERERLERAQVVDSLAPAAGSALEIPMPPKTLRSTLDCQQWLEFAASLCVRSQYFTPTAATIARIVTAAASLGTLGEAEEKLIDLERRVLGKTIDQ